MTTYLRVLDFDGTNDYVTMGNPAELQITNKLSVCVWAYWGGGGDRPIATKYASTGGQRSWLLGCESGSTQIRATLSDDGSFSAGHNKHYVKNTAPSAGWHFVAFTFDTGAFKLYYDGGEVTGAELLKPYDDAIVSIFNSSAEVRLGAFGVHAVYWSGKIGSTSIWDTAVLSATEIARLYRSGYAADPREIVVTSGAVLQGAWLWSSSLTYPTVPDLSGNGNDGTMTNMASGDIEAGPHFIPQSGVGTHPWRRNRAKDGAGVRRTWASPGASASDEYMSCDPGYGWEGDYSDFVVLR